MPNGAIGVTGVWKNSWPFCDHPTIRISIMAEILTSPDWPIPFHSSQEEEIKAHLAKGGKVQLTYRVSMTRDEAFVAEQNPEHEERRKQREIEGKQRL